MVIRRFWFPMLAAAMLAGCTAGPDYVPVEPEVPDAWEAAVTRELYTPGTPLVTWWDALGDTLLTSFLRRAEFQSLDLATAVARVQEARALRGVAKGDYYPDLVLGGAFSRTQISQNSPTGQAQGGDVPPMNLWQLGLDSTWEIDVFGRVRRSVEAADGELGASIEDYRDVLVTLYAEVALAYVEVRSLQLRIDFAEANVSHQAESVELTRSRFEAGLTGALDVAQAESNFANSQAQIPTLEFLLNVARNRLAVLLAQPPGTLNAELEFFGPIPTAPDSMAVDLPADLMRRRPDVRRAERELAAQTARIGVATSALYPSFGLRGFLTLEAPYFSDLGESSSLGWGLIPGVRWNLFAGGKIRSQIRVEEARTLQLLLAYEQTVLSALEEVENAMVAYERERARRDRLRQAVDATQRSVSLVHTQYVSGLTNFQNYLDMQRSLFDQQDQLAVSEGQVIENLIRLNKALGGGWMVQPEAPDQIDRAAVEEPDDSAAEQPSTPE